MLMTRRADSSIRFTIPDSRLAIISSARPYVKQILGHARPAASGLCWFGGQRPVRNSARQATPVGSAYRLFASAGGGRESPAADQARRLEEAAGVEGFPAALAFLHDPAALRLPAGRHPVDGDRIYANVVRDAMRDPASGKFEAHRKYADIHCLIRGSETIGFAPPARLKLIEPYQEGDDVLFYAVPPRFTRLLMKPGELVVFRPGDPHLPSCHGKNPCQIHKIVMKVRI
jgi:YhcH/YjgK/YiaL family protein